MNINADVSRKLSGEGRGKYYDRLVMANVIPGHYLSTSYRSHKLPQKRVIDETTEIIIFQDERHTMDLIVQLKLREMAHQRWI